MDGAGTIDRTGTLLHVDIPCYRGNPNKRIAGMSGSNGA
jgi:hypothetical protein